MAKLLTKEELCSLLFKNVKSRCVFDNKARRSRINTVIDTLLALGYDERFVQAKVVAPLRDIYFRLRTACTDPHLPEAPAPDAARRARAKSAVLETARRQRSEAARRTETDRLIDQLREQLRCGVKLPESLEHFLEAYESTESYLKSLDFSRSHRSKPRPFADILGDGVGEIDLTVFTTCTDTDKEQEKE